MGLRKWKRTKRTKIDEGGKRETDARMVNERREGWEGGGVVMTWECGIGWTVFTSSAPRKTKHQFLLCGKGSWLITAEAQSQKFTVTTVETTSSHLQRAAGGRLSFLRWPHVLLVLSNRLWIPPACSSSAISIEQKEVFSLEAGILWPTEPELFRISENQLTNDDVTFSWVISAARVRSGRGNVR